MTYGLTRRQAEALAFIVLFISYNGFSPSYSEIAEALGLKSKGAVFRIVHDIRKRGHIALDPTRARSIIVLKV
jgi:repressor LexA